MPSFRPPQLESLRESEPQISSLCPSQASRGVVPIHLQQFRRQRHVDLSHSFRLRILHQDTARICQAQCHPIFQHHSRQKRKPVRTFIRRAEMETDTPSDEDALPSATAAQSARVEG
jgi:hypothetical protein